MEMQGPEFAEQYPTDGKTKRIAFLVCCRPAIIRSDLRLKSIGFSVLCAGRAHSSENLS